MTGERLAAIELEHRLALAEKQNAALEAKLAECVAALDWYWDNWGTNNEEMRSKGYKLAHEVLAKVKK